jgi:CheY-like chemotaxis protein
MSRPLSGFCALLAQDEENEDEAVRSRIQRQIRSFGLSLDVARSLVEAGALARSAEALRRRYDIVLLDARAAEADKFASAGLWSVPSLAGAAVVLINQDARPPADVLRRSNIAAFLLKPVTGAHLLSVLERVLKCDARRLPAAAASASGPLPPEPEGKQLSILVAEDNRVNQKVMGSILKRLGYHADFVSNGREAVDAASVIPYDLILMDCQMPVMDGYEATRRIRAAEASGHHATIVALTANALAGDREKCLEAGMDDYLPKPIRHEDILRVFLNVRAVRRADEPDRNTRESAAGSGAGQLSQAIGEESENFARAGPAVQREQ